MSAFQLPPEWLLSLAKLTAVLLLALVGLPLIKRPAMRAAFWSAVFIILPLAIFATHGRSMLKVLPNDSSEITAAQVEIPSLETAVPITPSTDTEVAVSPEAPSNPEPPVTAWNPITLIFFGGFGMAMLPVLVTVLRLRFTSKVPAAGRAVETWYEIEPEASGAIPLYFTDNPSAPCAVGLIRPRILLPESSGEWTPRRLKSTLLHEAAHIRRRDPLFRCLASLVRAVLWFHPLIWLAHRQLVVAQEEACDEIAVSSGIAPDDYAEDLLEAARFNQSSLDHCLSMARWSQLGSRVRQILKKKPTPTKPLTMKNIALLSTTVAATIFALSTIGFAEPAPAKAPEAVAAEEPGADGSAFETKLRKIIIIETKLQKIIIPRISFENTRLSEAVDFLRVRSLELDSAESGPDEKGVNFMVKMPRDRVEPVIAELDLKNVPLGTALKYICELTEMSYSAEEFAVVLRPEAKAEKKEPVDLKKSPVEIKLREIIIPVVNFENTAIEDALEFLRMRSTELDEKTVDPNKKGVNFVLRPAEGEKLPVIPGLRLRNVPISVALDYICQVTGTRWQADDHAVVITPAVVDDPLVPSEKE